MSKKVSVRTKIQELEVGGSCTFPALKVLSVRNQASAIGFMLDRKYSTHQDSETRTVIVTRIK